MRKLRVVHVLPHLRPGGAERVAVHMVRGLDPDRFDVGVLSLGPPCGSDLERMVEERGIRPWFLGKHPGFDPRMFYRVHRALSEVRPDILHTHVHVLRYTLPSTLFRAAPVMIHTVHNVAEHEVERRAQWLQKVAFTKGHVVPVAVAAEVAASLRRLYGLGGAKVVPNAIPVDTYSHPQVPRREWRQREGFSPEDVLLVCVARFEQQKNHPLLLRAFAAGPVRNLHARLLLVGRGPQKAEVEGLAERMGLAGRVRFLGLRTDVPDILGACDAFVLSSDFEGNPLAVLEAMAAGLPIVSTTAGGVPELVETGVHGCLVRPGDLDGLAGAMMTVAESEDFRRRLGRAAQNRARREFDVPVMVRAYTELYDRLYMDATGGKEAAARNLSQGS